MVKTTVTEEVKNFLEENCIIVTDSDTEDDLDKSYYYMPDWMYIDGDELTIYSFKELPKEMKSVIKTIRRERNHMYDNNVTEEESTNLKEE